MVLRVVLVCTLISVLSPAADAAAQALPETARAISGTVVDAQARTGLAGARVRVVAPSAGEPAASMTIQETLCDGDGRFTATGLAPGRYRLVVAVDGFAPFEYPRDVVVTADLDPPAVEIAYVLRFAAEAGATAEARTPADTAVGSAMNVLDGTAVAGAPGGLEDVMRVFQKRPGVAASQDDRNDLLVRGGGAIENATRVDGFDIGNPAHFGSQGGSGGGFSFIAPWLIDRAVLRAGGFSVAFGERASSVLDLTLKSGAKDAVHGQAGASIGGALGEIEGPIAGGRGSWLFSARRSFLELVLKRGTDTAVPHYSDFIGRVEYGLSPAHRVEVLGIGAVDDVFVRSGNSTDTIQDDQTSALVGLSLHSQWNARTASAVYVSYGRSTVDGMMNGRNGADGIDRSKEIETRARGEVYRALGADGQAMVGVAVKKSNLRFDLDAKGFRNDYNYVVPVLHSHFPYAFADGSSYAEVRLPTVHRLQVTPAIRFERLGTTGRFYTSPRLNLEYRVAPAVKLSAAYGVYRQQIPNIWIGSNVANASLDPVWSVQALAGVSLRLPASTDVVVEAFDKRYTGYPIDPAEPWHVLVDAAADFESPFVGRLIGSGRLRADGVDTTVTRRFARHLTVGLSYSVWRVVQSGLDAAWRPSDYDIRHQGRLDLAYDIAGKWHVAAEWRYASGRPYTPFDVRNSVRANWARYDTRQLNGSNYPPYHRLDVRIDRTFTIRRSKLTVYGEVENAYNRQNLLVYEWSRSARQSRPIYQWGRLPLAGVRWQF